MKQITRNQKGFTLVEIAIVLVIIGLLLGGVLKGQEMIESAKIKGAVGDMNGVSAAYNSYVDRFRALPGDDGPTLPVLQARGGNWANITATGNKNGVVVNAAGNVFNPTNEGLAFWQHLKAAGFITGNPADTGTNALPRNSFNGLVGVGTGVTPVTGAAVFSICLSQTKGKAARAIDAQLDDTVSNRGSVLATAATVGANTAPGVAVATYSEDNIYTVCRPL
jgi:prepilin-type N-terminal cleavage/methylation domain-containing protein